MRIDGETVDFTDNKVRALLAYLALKPGQPHPRKALADLLWPDGKKSTDNLRNALASLRKTLRDQDSRPPFLSITADTVQVTLTDDDEIDVVTFATLLGTCKTHSHRRLERCRSCMSRYEQAAGLYRGEFLEGVSCEGSDDFDAWLTFNRAYYRRCTSEIVAHLAMHYEVRQHYGAAEMYARHWAALDRLNEQAYFVLMRALTFQGQRGAACDQYHILCHFLQKHDLLEPEPATTRLYEQIRTGMLPSPADAISNIPSQTSRFIGREQELSAISLLLEDPTHRIVTLLGPGGIGKTRLAIQAATDQKGVFVDGICFVSCVSVQSPEFLVATIAQELGYSLEGSADPTTHLLTYLQSREILFVLDNLEHLLHPGPALRDLLAKILQWAPHVTVLATSRERLDLKAEQPVYVEGLQVPSPDACQRVEDFSAVQLFVERAQHVQPAFVLQDADRTAMANICRMLDGMPLAVELAANWVRAGAIDNIEQNLSAGLHLLQASQMDVTERHRSMHVAFDHSYAMLSPEEQRVFRCLSVFRGRFTLQAAEHVAGATLPMMTSLVDQSLLRWKDERYEWHELLRQYAGEHVQAARDGAAVCDRHLEFYTRITEQFSANVTSAEQLAALDQLDRDLANIRVALIWSQTDRKRLAYGARIVAATFFYWYFRTLWSEGRAWAEQILAHSDMDRKSVAGARVLVAAGGLAWLQRDIEVASSRLTASIAVLRSQTNDPGLAYALLILGYTLLSRGNSADAEAHVREAVHRFRQHGDTWGLGIALTALGEVLTQRSQFNAAQECYQEALDIATILNRAGNPYIHALRGRLFCYQGAYAQARSESELSIAIARASGLERFMALALETLGLIATAQQEPAQALRSFAETIVIYREVGDQAGVAACIEGTATAQLLFRKPTLAAWLLGAAEALREEIQVPISPVDRADYERTTRAIRALIDEATFVSAWSKGRTTPIEHVIAVMLGKAHEPDI
jgi:predicted ATPase/Tfp pilus assembly protein PilF